ncbi:MAG: AAA family ATPase [Deltaproteobacteria bacterium]|nr:AAA family ATPase [Deltaproteobacteria bacterium]
MITSVRIEGFRSFKSAEVKLEPLTVLVGPNGAGKSNLVHALGTLRTILLAGMPSAPEDEAKSFGLPVRTLTFGGSVGLPWTFALTAQDTGGHADYELTLDRPTSRHHRLEVTRERLRYHDAQGDVGFDPASDAGGKQEIAKHIPFQLPSSSPAAHFARVNNVRAEESREATALFWLLRQLGFVDRFRPVPGNMRSSKLDWPGGVRSGGLGLVAELRKMKDRPRSRFPAVVDRLHKCFPMVEDVGFDVVDDRVELRFALTGISDPIPPEVVSDGVLLGLFYSWWLTTLDEAGSSGFTLFEDPSDGLHPYLYRQIASWLVGATEGRFGPRAQVVVVSHSPDFINEVVGEHLERLRIVERTDEGGTTFRALPDVDDEKQDEQLREMLKAYRNAAGTLWYSGSVGGYEPSLVRPAGNTPDEVGNPPTDRPEPTRDENQPGTR